MTCSTVRCVEDPNEDLVTYVRVRCQGLAVGIPAVYITKMPCAHLFLHLRARKKHEKD